MVGGDGAGQEAGAGMTLANSPRQRADFIRRIAHLQLAIADLHAFIDVAMRARPHPGIQKLLAMADVHLESAAQELAEAASDVAALT